MPCTEPGAGLNAVSAASGAVADAIFELTHPDRLGPETARPCGSRERTRLAGLGAAVFGAEGGMARACQELVKGEAARRPSTGQGLRGVRLLFASDGAAQLWVVLELLGLLAAGHRVVMVWPARVLERLRLERPAGHTVWTHPHVREVGIDCVPSAVPPAGLQWHRVWLEGPHAASHGGPGSAVTLTRGPAWLHSEFSLGQAAAELHRLFLSSGLPRPNVVVAHETLVPALFGALRQLHVGDPTAGPVDLPPCWMPWAAQLRSAAMPGGARLVSGFPAERLPPLGPATRDWLPLLGFRSVEGGEHVLLGVGPAPVAFAFDEDVSRGRRALEPCQPQWVVSYARQRGLDAIRSLAGRTPRPLFVRAAGG